MPATDDEGGRKTPRGDSRFMAFWTSLPGVLTGVAALITAVATLAALDLGGGRDEPASPGATATSGSATVGPETSTGTASEDAEGGCLGAYFEGLPPDRIKQVEVGTADFDAVTANQPKAGTVGLRFTNTNEPLGAMRIAFYPANALFKIESIVDAQCTPVEDYSNISRGGDKHVLQNHDTVRFQVDGDLYDLRIGASTTIRLNFDAYAP